MIDAARSAARVERPSVRKSFYEKGEAATGTGRGSEPFIEITWDEAERLVAHHVDRIRSQHGNRAIYGGSYGWASAGRFHHAQSQVHRFLNLAGGYTRSVQNYSYAAGDVILPHVIGSSSGLSGGHTVWTEIARHARHVLMFGGTPWKNAQINNGGTSRHTLRENLSLLKAAGVTATCISPIRDDAVSGFGAQWMPIRPNTDVALMLALCHEILAAGREDRAFLDRYTIGWEAFANYVTGGSDGIAKDPVWAAAITEIPAEDIRALAAAVLEKPTLVMVAWSLQRADHGEHTFWAAIALCCLMGTVGLPGLGFGFGYGATNGVGNPEVDFSWPALPQGHNAVIDFIPVARIADMLLNRGEMFHYNGKILTYPDIRMVYWAGGNPFHHHQDINKLIAAWRVPEVVVVHEPWWTSTARFADIVLPVTTQMERNDIACSSRDNAIIPSRKILEPFGEARNDFDIFAGIADRLGFGAAFTEGRDEEGWLRHMY
ncbi:molybdopterin-dependent oxidoreductase, partial [Rhizobiaceae sp. 2RAB30]